MGKKFGITVSHKQMDRDACLAAPPCFYFSRCKGVSVVNKQGRSICRQCADRMEGSEFPLRGPKDVE